jgi:hypothetical protein
MSRRAGRPPIERDCFRVIAVTGFRNRFGRVHGSTVASREPRGQCECQRQGERPASSSHAALPGRKFVCNNFSNIGCQSDLNAGRLRNFQRSWANHTDRIGINVPRDVV